MEKKTRFQRLRSAAAITSGVFVLTALVGGSAAWADGIPQRDWTTVSGTAVASDCGGSDFYYALRLSGDLDGCWGVIPEGYSCEELSGFDLYREWGREEFNGTRNGAPGRFTTKYTYEGAFSSGFCSDFNLARQIAGGCDHYVTGRGGSFHGVVGKISFFDIIPGLQADGTGTITPGPIGATDYLYVGKLNR